MAPRTTLLAAALFALGSPAAIAQSIAYDQPAQPLAQALDQFTRQAGLQVLAAPELIRGRLGQAISGARNISEALNQLLQGTGLRGRLDGKTLIIESVDVTLAPVNVTAAADHGNATEGTGSYTQSGATATATGLALSLRETPQSVTVVTRQKIDDFKLETLRDVLNQTPGISVRTEGDSVTFYARGAAIQNFQTDGARQGVESQSSLINHNLLHDDTLTIDRVEVLKGSAGLLQGDGNPSATVNMIRKKPTREFQAHVAVDAGSWDSYRTNVDISGPLNSAGDLRGRVVAAVQEADSFKDHVDSKSALLYGTLEFDLSTDTTLHAGLDYRQRESSGGQTMAGIQGYDSQGNFLGWRSRSWNPGADWSYYKQETLTFFAGMDHRFANGWNARLNASHKESRTPDWKVAALSSPGNFVNINRADIKDRNQGFSLDLSGPFQLLGRTHELLLGYNYSEITSRNDYYSAGADYWNVSGAQWAADNFYNGGGGMPEPAWTNHTALNKGETVRHGSYATARFNLTDELKLITGFRSSDYLQKTHRVLTNRITKIQENGVITPYAGVVLDLNRQVSLYASYASLFQPVTVRDQSGSTLAPQEGVTYEVGSKAELLDGRLNLALAHFWKRWENTYEATNAYVDGFPTERAYRNVDGVMERGYEIELSGELAPGWQAQGSYVLNSSELGNSNESPKQQFKLNTTYALSHLVPGLKVGAGTRWQSKISAGPLEQKAYWLLDLMAHYRFNRNVSASLNINNALDKKYFAGVTDWSSWGSAYGSYYTWGEPRRFNLSLRYEF